MFEGSIKGISMMFQGSFKGRKIKGCSERLPRVIEGYQKEFQRIESLSKNLSL